MGEAIGLLDIAPRWVEIPVETADGERSLKVYGVTSKRLIEIAMRFPEGAKLIIGGERDPKTFAAELGQATAALIASACGHHGNAEHEAKAEDLTPEVQADVLAAMAKLTFSKGGFGPFAQRLREALNAVSAQAGSGQAMSSASP